MDRISQLPDCILSYILSMLSMKDRLKTGVLSKRWCNLWSLARDLNFDINNMLGSKKELIESGYVFKHNNTFLDFELSRDEFVHRVDQFLNNFQGTKIDSFLLDFYLHHEQSYIIDQWISFAIARGVARIDLLFLGRMPYHVHKSPRKPYKFNFGLFGGGESSNASTLKHLSLQYSIVSHSTNCDYFRSFKNLRSLALETVEVDEMFITSLSSNCPLLEKLCLVRCKVKSLLPKIIRIVSLSLLHLEVEHCRVLGISKPSRDINMFLDCLKLTSLMYRGLETLHINTPMLKSIDYKILVNDDRNAFALFATLPELEILRLAICVPVELVATSLKITPLKHLKQLNIFIFSDWIRNFEFLDVLGILSILQTSPLLQELSVMVTHPKFLENQKDMKDIEIFSHDEVKVIELGGCVGNWYEAEFVMNVLKYAHKLERVVLSPYWREYDFLDWNFDPLWFQNGRERIIEKLQAKEVVGLAKLKLI